MGLSKPMRRRTLTGAALAAVVGLGAVQAFVQVAGSGRRQLLGAVFGAGVVATGSEARAELFEPALPGSGMANNPKQKISQEQDLQTMIKKELGTNLGRIMNIKDGCFETEGAGFTARISTSSVVVWDPDAPCGEGKAFIHAAGQGQKDWSPMTASGGATKHTYYAGTFVDGNIVGEYKLAIGTCKEIPNKDDYSDAISWEVANTQRGGKC